MSKQIATAANTVDPLAALEAQVEALKVQHADAAPYLTGARHRENIAHGISAVMRGLKYAGKYGRTLVAGAPETDAEKLERLQKELAELKRLG